MESSRMGEWTDASSAHGSPGEPLVSVVVIVYDGERFLGEALESIAAQTFERWEAIVVDDGSRDRSRAIAMEFAARHPGKVRVLRHEGDANRGMSASRNLGIAESRGEFVTFLDHDDAMCPQKLARQVELLRAHPGAVAVVGPNLRWHSWRGDASDRRADETQDLGVADLAGTAVELDPPGLLPIFLARSSATPQSPMLRRERLREIGGFEPSFRGMYEDQAFLARLFLASRTVASGEVWQKYRQHEGSCVSRSHRAGEHFAARRRFLAWLEPLLDPARPGHRALAREVRRQWWRTWRMQWSPARLLQAGVLSRR
jgi:glycosyltransferase involved in cell wall biosynthesis